MWNELEEAFIDAYLSAADKHIKERMAEIRAMETPVYLTEEQREQYRRDAIRAPFRAAIAATPTPNAIDRDVLLSEIDQWINASEKELPSMPRYSPAWNATNIRLNVLQELRSYILAIAPDSREVGS